MPTIEFRNNDKAYQDWISRHSDGYVINTPKSKPAYYMTLHRANCRLIGQYNDMAKPGGFTERKYIKICSTEISSLTEWLKKNGRLNGTFSGKCSRCNP